MFDRSGAPVDRALLRAFTDFLSYVGPDARDTYTNGCVGLGHAMLRTSRESACELLPASLDGQLWITADARIDCREELNREFGQAEPNRRRSTTDSDLILRAYALWGEECVQHLRGDFAFAIWDAPRKRLFCARDHFGLKPFYYAEIGEVFLFSNTLNCVRLHPEISDELNDSAIGDFLLFGLNCDATTTTFRDIRRLPPAHSLSACAEGVRIQRYWSAPTHGTIRYRHADEYVERFQYLLQAAVADRLRIDRAGILLSGGLDSAALAASAREVSGNPADAADLRAYTLIYEPLISDRDGAHARKVADFLNIPIQFLEIDVLKLFERWNDPEFSSPEPVDDPLFAGLFDQYKMIERDCRVALCGEGGDNLLHFQMLPYAKHMLRTQDFRGLLREIPRYLRLRPSVWPGIRRRLKRIVGKDPKAPLFPRWLDPDFARRLDLEARWKEWSELPAYQPHPIRPKAHASLSIPHWASMFEQESPGVTHCLVETRYPFLDLRVVNYLLALPPFPFCFEKSLLRDAMVGRLPESCRLRPKATPSFDPLVQCLQQAKAVEWLDQVQWSGDMHGYVQHSSLKPLQREDHAEQLTLDVRPACLNFWLQSSRRVRYNWRAEVGNA
jgi:asparagine synthase (glutamine-hydrolysing)